MKPTTKSDLLYSTLALTSGLLASDNMAVSNRPDVYTPSTLTKKQRLKRNKRNKMQKESRRINKNN